MARLKEVFEDAGHAEVRTYINSGNVVFDAPRQKLVGSSAFRLRSRELVGSSANTTGFLERSLGVRGALAPEPAGRAETAGHRTFAGKQRRLKQYGEDLAARER